MPKYVMKDAYIAINGTAISDHCSNLTFEDSADEVDFTSFSANSYREIGQGLKDATITVSVFADFAANSVHAILQPIYASGGTALVEIRPTSAVPSSTNPKVQMFGRMFGYSPMSGAVGDAASFDCAFRNAGTLGPIYGTT